MTAAETQQGRQIYSAGPLPRRVWLPALSVMVIGTIVVVAREAAPLGAGGDWLVPRMPVVMAIALVSTAFAALLGITAGALAAHHGRKVDRALSVVLLAGHIVPAVWVAMAVSPRLVGLASPLPSVEYVAIGESLPGWLASISVPLIALALGSAAAIARQIAATSRDLLQSDLVRTLRSRGLPRAYILRVHVLRRCVLAPAQLLGLHFLGLVGATLVMDAVVVQRGGSFASTTLSSSSVVITLAVFVAAAIAVVAVGPLRGAWMAIVRARERAA
ncbi:ABC transporter permease subunit [Cryobacterium psychrophilum]|uniref:ABC transporter permease subunit n=1 Tax=Cryobacterium psychrophilum TaxID=41988 RepID=A0A4Y8KSW1_9MICO|nr:ABC transporter permease subunit [Cryobacterium psychrophilum]TDW30439.1 binding-protein-dependent transport system inner membrane component [Cryobacterium psychrophilum]TFD79519.1 ABC transporter permease subunit [Cryobacterium psychrophilum]